MPVTPMHEAGNILWQASGRSDGVTSVNVPHPDAGGTAAGNAVIIVATSNQPFATPSGFVLDHSAANTGLYGAVFRKQPTSAGETSWTVGLSGTPTATTISWRMLEVVGLAASPRNYFTSGIADTTSGAVPTLSLPDINAGGSGALNDLLVVGLWALRTNNDPATLGGFVLTPRTGAADTPWRPVVEQKWGTDSAGTRHYTQFWQSFPYPLGTTRAVGQVADVNTGGATMGTGDFYLGVAVAYASANSGAPEPVGAGTGFEFGTHGGLTAGPTNALKIASSTAGTWGTNFLVQSGSARSGTYDLRIVQTGAAAYLRWDNTGKLPTGLGFLVTGFGVKPVSGTGIVVLAETNPAAGTIAQLVYNHATSQLGMRWGSGGTISYQDGTSPVGTYVWVDWSVNGLTGTTWTMAWSLNRVEQDPPADLTGQTASSVASFNVGANVAQTQTSDYDDVCLSWSQVGNYPLGPHKIVRLGVDPAATPSGTLTTNFNVFTANGTLAAWNATNARNAVDEVPPDLSATADGVVQVTASTGSFVTFPMSTYTLTLGEIINGVFAMWALWANGTGSATLDLRVGVGGGGSQVLMSTATAFNPGNAPTALSATAPMWAHAKVSLPGGWIQTNLDGLTLEMGRSDDATPDIGASAMYVEAAIAEARTMRIYGPDADGMTVDLTQGAGNNEVEKYDVTAGATRGATLRYVLGGVAQDPVVITAGSGVTTVTIGAHWLDDVSRVTIEPDPVT